MVPVPRRDRGGVRGAGLLEPGHGAERSDRAHHRRLLRDRGRHGTGDVPPRLEGSARCPSCRRATRGSRWPSRAVLGLPVRCRRARRGRGDDGVRAGRGWHPGRGGQQRRSRSGWLSLEETDPQGFLTQVAVPFHAVFLVTRAFIDPLLQRRSRWVVTVNSPVAYAPWPGASPAAAPAGACAASPNAWSRTWPEPASV